MKKLVLASASPRRAELLGRVGIEFEVLESGAEEATAKGAPPADVALFNARAKAKAGASAAGADRTVLAADTVVALDGAILGKPASKADAAKMLGLLSGRTHEVVTAVVLVSGGRARELVVSTLVSFAKLGAGEIEWYVSTGEPMDKAGAYGIQGGAAGFVKAVEGSYTNVVGLPLAETLKMLESEGFSPWGRKR